MRIKTLYFLEDHLIKASGSTKLSISMRRQSIGHIWQRGQDDVSPLRHIVVVVG